MARVAVVIPTRDRPQELAPCLQSILAGSEQDFEVWFIDQSSRDDTARAFEPFRGDPRLHHVPSATRGNCAARNEGTSRSTAPIVVHTDDDCRPRADWLAQHLAEFEADATLGVVCGQVRVPQELLRPGAEAASFYPREAVFEGRLPPAWHWGITANLAVRRSVLDRVGPFDEVLGAGGRLRSGGDADWVRRATAVTRVKHSPKPEVIHLGVRYDEDARQLMLRYDYGLGAALLKGVRSGDLRVLRQAASILGTLSLGVLSRAIRLRRPLGARRVLSMMAGAWAAARTPLSADRRTFADPE
ncbi:MAG: glycosyltransferase [Deltaproteobacteria bacterium]|nr:glycosyltransferase [Deltaproteobacteria bacterium]